MHIVYNTTYKIDKPIEHEWLQWMLHEHIPAVMQTGCFESYTVLRIMDEEDEYGVGFAVQCVATSIENFKKYQNTFAKMMQQNHTARYKNQYVSFHTLMQIEAQGKASNV